ncbi:hypothetical protein CC2G_009547 [Coprinopsis cinerea AmutBmut pab1-1]|nr:hypothetical protein CC2G_009547 [Coprinopsis cinerea AmutBmut pab1-1]
MNGFQSKNWLLDCRLVGNEIRDSLLGQRRSDRSCSVNVVNYAESLPVLRYLWTQTWLMAAGGTAVNCVEI